MAARLTSAPIRIAAVSAGLAIAASSVSFAIPAASAAEGCSDVDVVFARGTNEPVGVGRVGQAFVDALQGQIPNQSVAVYAVNYPAS